MPQSRKRPGHHPHRKPADIPASQRTKGRITWAVLMGIFGLLVAYFAAGSEPVTLVLTTLIAAIAGYMIGKKMEKEVAHK